MTAPTPANFFGPGGGNVATAEDVDFDRLSAGLSTSGGNDMKDVMPDPHDAGGGSSTGGGSANSLRMSVDEASDGRPLSAKGRALFFRHIGGDGVGFEGVAGTSGNTGTGPKPGEKNINYRYGFNSQNYVYDVGLSEFDDDEPPLRARTRTRNRRRPAQRNYGIGARGGGAIGGGIGGGVEVRKGRTGNSQRLIEKAAIQQKMKGERGRGKGKGERGRKKQTNATSTLLPIR